jgi:hypothetical protein
LQDNCLQSIPKSNFYSSAYEIMLLTTRGGPADLLPRRSIYFSIVKQAFLDACLRSSARIRVNIVVGQPNLPYDVYMDASRVMQLAPEGHSRHPMYDSWDGNFQYGIKARRLKSARKVVFTPLGAASR